MVDFSNLPLTKGVRSMEDIENMKETRIELLTLCNDILTEVSIQSAQIIDYKSHDTNSNVSNKTKLNALRFLGKKCSENMYLWFFSFGFLW